MEFLPDILKLAARPSVFADEMQLLQERERILPGEYSFSFRRYLREPGWNVDDMGAMVYELKEGKKDNKIELHFCLAGKIYCAHNQKCAGCNQRARTNCREKLDSLDVVSLRFNQSYLTKFIQQQREDKTLSSEILSFRHKSSFTKTLSICGRSKTILESLLSTHYTGALENIYVDAQTQMLLLFSLECMVGDREIDVFQCKFLANDDDREKIIRARELLIQHIGEPITIKELSRKVAINECYLKKGFKELFGTTIFDFYQSQRMEHARYLLYEKGLSVTDVSMVLGYSSISHFSTAFKRHTGLKPCELLLRN